MHIDIRGGMWLLVSVLSLCYCDVDLYFEKDLSILYVLQKFELVCHC